jgi:adenylate kinase
MASPEILLLGGAPGSGKSSIAKRFVELGKPEGARHLSIGDLKRSIVAGEIPSAFAEMLQQREHPDRKTGAAPSEAMTGIMEEFILARPDGLAIVDGFPRYMDRVAPFKESMAKIGANVLALCVVEIDEAVLIERLGGRAERSGQKIKDPLERLADHRDNVMPTLEVLAADHPSYTLDGALPLDVNAAELLTIYERHTTSS